MDVEAFEIGFDLKRSEEEMDKKKRKLKHEEVTS
jgi:hypothetical protein